MPVQALPVLGGNRMGGVARSVGCTHVGLVRAHNEDSFLERPDLGLWAVADGMGGATAGEVASQAVVSALDAIPGPLDASAMLGEVRTRIAAVNDELLEMAAGRGPDTIIGTTVAGLLVHSGWFACFWAGDSRVYRFRGGTLDQLTRDHSLVQDMVDAGVLAAADAESHPHASVIQRAVGVDAEIELQWVHARVEDGDVFLLCSDGLTRMVRDDELQDALGHSLEEACSALLALTLQRGARDNVTMVLVAVG